ncbi:MAG: Hsp20/alpha crystallin family protein [Desulfosalsimonadaceae bacterium]
MALARTNPWAALPTLQNRVNRLFDDMFPEISAGDDMGLMDWRPVVDTYEKDNAIVVNAELPGVKKEDISIDVKNNMLTISGERKDEENIHEDDYYRNERFYGRFQRSFTLPDNVDADKVDATYKDGVLEVKIPKTEDSARKKIEVK